MTSAVATQSLPTRSASSRESVLDGPERKLIAKRWIFLWTFLPLVFLYGGTAAPTVTGEDSGELVTAAWTLDVAHPPGYPLWLLITHVFQGLFQGAANPAEAANIASGVTTAVAMALLAVLAYQVTRSFVAAWVGALICGLGHETWNHATITEVYALNLLILAACLILFRHWAAAPSNKRLFALAVVYGAGLTHHPTFQLFLPVFAIAIVCRRPRTLKSVKEMSIAIGGLVLPFVVYFQVLIAAANDPWISWGVKPTVASVFEHWMREIYWTGLDKTDLTVAKLWAKLVTFTNFMLRELSLPGLLLGFGGLVYLFRRSRLFGGLCLSLACVGTLGLLFVVRFDIEREDLFTSRVFLMPAYVVLGLGIAVSVAYGLSRLRDPYLSRARYLVLLLPVVVAGFQFKAHDRSDYRIVEKYARAILSKLPKDAVLIPGGDTSTFPVLYLQKVQKERRDVRIIDRSGAIERDEALALLPEARRDEFRRASRNLLIDALVCLSEHPVITLKNRPPPKGTGFVTHELGMGFIGVKKADKKGRALLREYQRRYIRGLSLSEGAGGSVRDYSVDVIMSHVCQVRGRQLFKDGNPPGAVKQLERAIEYSEGIKEVKNNVGAMLAEEGLRERAVVHFKNALEIRPDYRLARRNLVITLAALGKNQEIVRFAEEGMVVQPDDTVVFEEGTRAAMELKDAEALQRICDARIAALPQDPRPHRVLGKWALEQGNRILAQVHFAKAVRKDPTNRSTREELAALEKDMGLPSSLPPAGAERSKTLDTMERLLGANSARSLAFAGQDGRQGRLRNQGRIDRFAPVPGEEDLKALLMQGAPEKFNPLAGLSLPDDVKNKISGSPDQQRDVK